jgi:hypothetical protein
MLCNFSSNNLVSRKFNNKWKRINKRILQPDLFCLILFCSYVANLRVIAFRAAYLSNKFLLSYNPLQQFRWSRFRFTRLLRLVATWTRRWPWRNTISFRLACSSRPLWSILFLLWAINVWIISRSWNWLCSSRVNYWLVW